MNATKALIFTCTCTVALAAGQSAGASIAHPAAVAATVTGAGPQRERIQALLAEQGLPDARSLAGEITREILRRDEFVPARATLQPHQVQRFAAAGVERPHGKETDREPAEVRTGNDRPGVLTTVRRLLAEFLRLSG